MDFPDHGNSYKQNIDAVHANYVENNSIDLQRSVLKKKSFNTKKGVFFTPVKSVSNRSKT